MLAVKRSMLTEFLGAIAFKPNLFLVGILFFLFYSGNVHSQLREEINPELRSLPYLQEAGSISGLVTDAEEEVPIINIQVTLRSENFTRETCTDANGQYSFTDLPIQTAFIISSGGANTACGGAQNFVTTYWQNTYRLDAATTIVLTEEIPAITGADFALQKFGTASGRVLDKETGNPLADIEVTFSSEHFFAVTCTDEDGRYFMTELPRAEDLYVSSGGLNSDCPGSGVYKQQFWQEADTTEEATIVRLTRGAPDATRIDFSLTKLARIAGKVIDAETGEPIENIEVAFFGEDYYAQVCTNAQGEYFYDELPFDMPLRVGAGGDNEGCEGAKNYIRDFWAGDVGWNDATLITLTEEAALVNEIDFGLDLSGNITGLVTDALTGEPVPNVRVRLTSAEFYPYTCTNAQGIYRLNDLPLGAEFLLESGGLNDDCFNSTPYMTAYWQGTTFKQESTPITLTRETPSLTDLNLVLPLSGSITGRVTDIDTGEPLANVRVLLSSDELYPRVCTDTDGRYIIENLPLGVEFRAYSGGRNDDCTNSDPYLAVYWEETNDVGEAKPITLTSDASHLTDIDFALPLGGSISGTVTDAETGEPVPDVRVFLSNDDLYPRACTDADGRYFITDLPLEVEFQVYSGGQNEDCNNPTPYLTSYWENTFLSNQSKPIVFTRNERDLTNIDFALSLTGSIAGRVTDIETGEVLPNMEVFFLADTFFARVCTDANGEYIATGLPRRVPLRIATGGDNPTCGGATHYRQAYWRNSSWSDAILLSLSENAPDRTGINFTLEVGGTIAGLLTDAQSGDPIPNTVVQLRGKDFYDRVCSDENGEYLFTEVPRDVELYVSGGGPEQFDCTSRRHYVEYYWLHAAHENDATPITLTMESLTATGIELSLEVGGSIAGVVINAETKEPIPDMQVNLYFADGGYLTTCTNAEGEYAMDLLPFGVYFRVSTAGTTNNCGGSTEFYREFYSDSSSWRTATVIRATVENPDLIDINMTPIWYGDFAPETQ